MKRILPPILMFVIVAVLAELSVRVFNIPAYLIPSPLAVMADLAHNTDSLWQAAGSTAVSALAGLGMSALLGITLAIVLSSSKWVLRAIYPYAVFFQTVPIIAVAPLLVIWIGYGRKTVIVSALIVSVFPMIANTLAGLSSTDPGLLDMFRLYGAGPLASLFKLRLPAAVPQILTGLRVAGGLAVIGAIVGEFIVGGGLGAVIETAKKQQNTDIVFAAIILASLLGLLMFGAVGLLSWILLGHWHPSERER